MNAEGTKRLNLIKSLVEEQGADGDKRWIIDQLVVSEATCQSLREQSSRWEAQALEAGVRIAELEAQVRGLREVASKMMSYTYPTEKMRGDLSDVLARADAALAGEPGERSYSAAEVREGFLKGYWDRGKLMVDGRRMTRNEVEAEALRRYPEKPQEGKDA